LTLIKQVIIELEESKLNNLNTNQSRLKAVAGEKFIVDGVEYIAVENISGCKGCVAENEKLPRKLCNSFPFCSDADISIIFVEVKND
jgi:hypothetical protein